MCRSFALRAVTLCLAFVHTFPARHHLERLWSTPSASEAWKALGSVAAIALYLLPPTAQARALGWLWTRHRGLLGGFGWLLAVGHAVPAFDHLPRALASPSWADAWRGVGAATAVVWFVLPLRTQAKVLGRLRHAVAGHRGVGPALPPVHAITER